MAEEAAATAARFSEEDFYCPICQEVFKTPVRTMNCQHVWVSLLLFLPPLSFLQKRSPRLLRLPAFIPLSSPRPLCRFCRKCFLTAMRESGTHCPLCRGSVTKKERSYPKRALDVENSMKKASGGCRCCEKQVDSRNDAVSANGEMANNQMRQGNTSGHPTFKCPLCQEANFTRQRLLDHCNNRHLYHIIPVICPICVSLPWADSNQVTRNLVSHLNLRHQFDYGEFVVSFSFFVKQGSK
ncbi:UNVERIFIED_CONTAM: hypothetical protein H355_008945 [Colinus virginianus]|nr:hypothetical protein H355_008945 [Colinus virginianus]